MDGAPIIYGVYKMTYITIPLLANIEIGKSFKFYGYGGLYMSFLNSAKNQTTAVTSSLSVPWQLDHSYDPTSEFYSSEKGALFGLGIKIPLCSKVQFLIDTRYETGFTKAARDDIEYKYYHVICGFKDVYNRSVSVNWGILYRFKSPE